MEYWVPECRLISYTKPIIMEAQTPAELLAYVARVSSPKSQETNDGVTRLLGYLVKHKHWSPFEMVDVTIEIVAPRDITRQIIRHKSFPLQEFSQRYASITALGFTLRECRMQDTANRQNSFPCTDPELATWWDEAQKEVLALVEAKYSEALRKGIAKEVARVILPEGNTLSRMYFKGSVRSWIHYLETRLDESTQLEHRLVAREAQNILRELMPAVFELVGMR